jgi:DNA-binding GntR family transcriptional regulator
MLPKINKTKTKSEQAHEVIKESIIKNELLPGEEISIDSLASSLGISHTPVREAVARLSNDGLINYEAHKKLRVSKITPEDVRQIYEVRRLLEPYAATRVIDAAPKDPSMMKDLRRLFAKASQVCNSDHDRIDTKAYLEIDARIDEIFLRSAGQTLFGEVYNLVEERSLRVRTFAEAVSSDSQAELMRLVTAEHLSILEALIEGNIDIAKVRVLQHLKNGEARTLKALQEKLSH